MASTIALAVSMVVAVPSRAEAPIVPQRVPVPPPSDEVWLARQVPAPAASSVDALDRYRGLERGLGPLELRELLELVGFRGEGLRSAWAVAMKESRGEPLAHNDNPSTGDDSYGLFQINMIGGMGPARRAEHGLSSNSELLDPVTNARIAFTLSKGGTDFGHWGIGPNAYAGGKPRDYPYWLTQYPEG